MGQGMRHSPHWTCHQRQAQQAGHDAERKPPLGGPFAQKVDHLVRFTVTPVGLVAVLHFAAGVRRGVLDSIGSKTDWTA